MRRDGEAALQNLLCPTCSLPPGGSAGSELQQVQLLAAFDLIFLLTKFKITPHFFHLEHSN